MDWKAYPDELEGFADILWHNDATVDTADAISKEIGRFRHYWLRNRTLTLSDGLPLPSPRKKALHPRGCEIESAELRFLFHFANDGGIFPEQADFQVCVKGSLLLNSSVVVELEDHWRIDTHMYSARQGEQDCSESHSESVEPHPLFHFQRGGYAQNGFADDPGFVPGDCLPDRRGAPPYRGLMQLPGPRVPSLPMCPILAVDFTISQCNGTVWRQLRETPEYSNLIGSAQERLWTPIFDRFSDSSFRQSWLGGLLVV